jgi:alkylhydroperoxidase family enzyme
MVRPGPRHGDVSSLDPKGRAAMALARAISPSPAALDDTVLESTRTLEPAAIIELVVWLSVLQMLHRLGAYYRA